MGLTTRRLRSLLSVMVALVLGVSALGLVGCGGQPSAEGGSGSDKDAGGESPGIVEVPADGSPEQIIEAVQADFAATQQGLLDEQASLFAEVGTTYEGYTSHVEDIQAWYDLAVSETEALAQRTVENGRTYYQSIVDNVDLEDDDAVEDAMDDYYDLIYDDAFSDYYDVVYDDAFDEMYDQFYDGILDDAFDTVDYEELSDVRSDAYDAWSDSHGDVYDAWSDGHGDVYDEWLDVKSDFYQGEFDVADTLRLDGAS